MRKTALSMTLAMLMIAGGSAAALRSDIQAPRGEQPEDIQSPRGEHPEDIQSPRGAHVRD